MGMIRKITVIHTCDLCTKQDTNVEQVVQYSGGGLVKTLHKNDVTSGHEWVVNPVTGEDLFLCPECLGNLGAFFEGLKKRNDPASSDDVTPEQETEQESPEQTEVPDWCGVTDISIGRCGIERYKHRPVEWWPVPHAFNTSPTAGGHVRAEQVRLSFEPPPGRIGYRLEGLPPYRRNLTDDESLKSDTAVAPSVQGSEGSKVQDNEVDDSFDDSKLRSELEASPSPEDRCRHWHETGDLVCGLPRGWHTSYRHTFDALPWAPEPERSSHDDVCRHTDHHGGICGVNREKHVQDVHYSGHSFDDPPWGAGVHPAERCRSITLKGERCGLTWDIHDPFRHKHNFDQKPWKD